MDKHPGTITKKLTLTLRNLAKHAADCEKEISKDCEDYPANGKAFQRVIRERMAEQPDPLLAERMALAGDFTNANVREISREDARNVIVATNTWARSARKRVRPIPGELGRRYCGGSSQRWGELVSRRSPILTI